MVYVPKLFSVVVIRFVAGALVVICFVNDVVREVVDLRYIRVVGLVDDVVIVNGVLVVVDVFVLSICISVVIEF